MPPSPLLLLLLPRCEVIFLFSAVETAIFDVVYEIARGQSMHKKQVLSKKKKSVGSGARSAYSYVQ
jgi:hypothetical protein